LFGHQRLAPRPLARDHDPWIAGRILRPSQASIPGRPGSHCRNASIEDLDVVHGTLVKGFREINENGVEFAVNGAGDRSSRTIFSISMFLRGPICILLNASDPEIDVVRSTNAGQQD